jgi:outer membrane receptor for ferrienterochelin and colicin
VKRASRAKCVATATVALLGIAVPYALDAQTSCEARATDVTESPADGWAPPLDRPVSLVAREVSLRDALDRVAAAARIRLSYSSDLLPLDQRVCVSFHSTAAGDALSQLLGNTGVEARVAGGDHVALSPVRESALAPRSRMRAATVLERVVVTGTVAGAAQRSLTVGLEVIPGDELRRRAAGGSLSDVLNGAVPGVWLWEQSPSNLMVRYASIRGASSFGISYPKIYIDGIEVANPLLVARVSSETIERIEIIRGPQGAALYGTDAISGVVNIITRTGGASDGGGQLTVRSEAGATGSAFGAASTVSQRHSLVVRAGSGLQSVSLGLTAGSAGAFVPSAYSRQFGATATARVVRPTSIVTATARFQAEEAGAPPSPVLDSLFAGPSIGPTRQSVQQYTVGANVKVTQNERWTHTGIFGVDGYRLSGVGDDLMPIPSAADAALRSANGSGDRATVRLSSVAKVGSVIVPTAITFAVEQSLLRTSSDDLSSDMLDGRSSGRGVSGGRVIDYGTLSGRTSAREYGTFSRDGGSPGGLGRDSTEYRANTGFIAQANTAISDVAYLSAGVRLEHNDGFGVNRWSTLPMLGFAVVAGGDDAQLKLRVATGKGIRSARNDPRESMQTGVRGPTSVMGLAPESQSGIEGGFDLYVGRALTLRVTRFDQIASGLIQRVAIGIDSTYSSSGPGPGTRHVAYELQNVGKISNAGWEIEGSLARGPLVLSGGLTLTESNVRRRANSYTGDLREGDRMLEVPRQTLSAGAVWSAERWRASLNASRASDWINYDRIGLASAIVRGQQSPNDSLGPWLRSYWQRYSGVTRLRASFAYDLRSEVALLVSGENLLGEQRGEPDNVTVLPGRTVSVGLRIAAGSR